jgi:phosphatidylglycerophosphatase A
VGFGSGSFKVAPGTFGSLAAVGVWCVVQATAIPTSTFAHIAFVAVVVVAGTIAIRESLRQLSEEDPGWIVIDEWAGMFVALMGSNPMSLSQVLFAFLAFRFFDISKLGPVRAAERLPGAWGVMLDDLVAGAFAWVVVQAFTPLARDYGLLWGGPGLW